MHEPFFKMGGIFHFIHYYYYYFFASVWVAGSWNGFIVGDEIAVNVQHVAVAG